MRRARLLLVAALVAGATAAFSGDPAASGDDVEAVRARAQEATQALADAEARLGELDQQITTAQHQADEAQRQIDALQGEVAELIVQQYIRPDDQLLVDEDDLSRVARGDALLRIVTHGDADSLDAYEGAHADLEAASAQLTALQTDQQGAVAELEHRQADLQTEIARLEELERERREAEERARQAEIRRQQQLAQQQQQQQQDQPEEPEPTDPGGGSTTPPPSGGGITCPVPGATFVDTWGAPRSGGRSHEGVDMMASMGTHILSPAAGNVEFREVSTGGLSFYVYGDNGDTYFGTHLSGYEGGNRHVSAGELIGYVGDSGNAAGTPHLHFEIHPGGGGPVNPYPATAAAC